MTLINSPLQQEVVVWEGILDGDVQGWTVGLRACGGGGYGLEHDEVASSSLSLSRSSSLTSSKSSSSLSVAGMVWSMGGLGR